MRRFIPTFGEDLPTLIMVGLMLIIPAAGMVTAGWAAGISILYLVVIAAVWLGYLLAVSRLSDLVVILLSGVYGIFSTWVVGGQLIKGDLEWNQRQLEVVVRTIKWFQEAAGGGFSRDNLMFVMLMALIFWFLAINATLNTFRSRQLWIACIPPGLALLINAYYYFGSARMDLFLIVYLFLVFTLAVRTNALLREKLWQQSRVGYGAGVRGDLLRGGIIGALVLVVLAWAAPAASASNQLASAWDRSINPWNRVQDTFNRLFSGLEGGTATTADYYGGATLSLGGPVSLTDTTVMFVYAPPGYHYYWRSKLFDYYDGRRWLTLADERKDSDYGVLPAEEDTGYSLRANVQQQFQMVIPASRLIYAAPQAISFTSLPVTFDEIFTFPPSKTYGTVASVRARSVITSGRTYTVTSSLSLADETSLRAAPTDYPDWVTSRYLQLPSEVTQRTRDLAAGLVAPYTNPYDKARAIEAYLRTNIKYNIAIEPPPGGVEPVDHFLFTTKEGYCNYYASAMTVMLRSQGIPARVAAGFAQGDLNPGLNAYRVRELNAHTWVEVYFPRLGWVEFEPTTVITPIVRAETSGRGAGSETLEVGPSGPAATPTVDVLHGPGRLLDSEREPAHLTDELTRPSIEIAPVVWWLVAMLCAGVLTAGGLWFWLEIRGMRGLSEVSRSYARMNLFASLAGLPLADGTTPVERGEQIASAVPKGDDLARRIASNYAQEQYAPPRQVGAPLDRREAIAHGDWQLLRPIMVREILSSLLSRIRRRRS